MHSGRVQLPQPILSFPQARLTGLTTAQHLPLLRVDLYGTHIHILWPPFNQGLEEGRREFPFVHQSLLASHKLWPVQGLLLWRFGPGIGKSVITHCASMEAIPRCLGISCNPSLALRPGQAPISIPTYRKGDLG